ncbi:ABC-type glycerol-3-phosphate transport system, substrate-binding protein [Paenibacillaceae bacterium GAS479]|nr:ABC-type glycerol-3-phosphate transport system, substrate-binding protein [Paenibacillaceae bacterium GAS479]
MKKENRKRFQKIIALCLVMLVLSVVTACTGGGGNNGGAVTANNGGSTTNQGAGAETNSPPESSPTVAIDKTAIKGEVKVLGASIDNFKKMMVDFNKEYPNVKVIAMEQSFHELAALIAAGEKPDVIFADGGRFPLQWIKDNLIQDMKPFMDNDPEITADMFYEPAFTRGLGVDGQVWQLPYTVDPNFTMMYNQDILEQYGDSEVPEMNSLQEFGDFLKKYWVVENGEQVMTTFSPLDVYGNFNSLITFAFLNGADQKTFYDPETNKASFNDPKIVEAMEWMLRFKRENIDDERMAKLNDSLPKNTSRFLASKSLLDPAVVSHVRDNLKANPDIQLKPMPAASLWMGGHGLSMTTLGTKENEMATWSLIKWITSNKVAAEAKLKTEAGLSAIKDNPYLVEQAKTDPVLSAAYEVLQKAEKHPPFLPVPFEEEFNKKYYEVLDGKLEPKAFLDYMTKYTQALLDDLNK